MRKATGCAIGLLFLQNIQNDQKVLCLNHRKMTFLLDGHRSPPSSFFYIFLYLEEAGKKRLFARNRFLGKNKEERPYSEAKRSGAMLVSGKRFEANKKNDFSRLREKSFFCLQSKTIDCSMVFFIRISNLCLSLIKVHYRSKASVISKRCSIYSCGSPVSSHSSRMRKSIFRYF